MDLFAYLLASIIVFIAIIILATVKLNRKHWKEGTVEYVLDGSSGQIIFFSVGTVIYGPDQPESELKKGDMILVEFNGFGNYQRISLPEKVDESDEQ